MRMEAQSRPRRCGPNVTRTSSAARSMRSRPLSIGVSTPTNHGRTSAGLVISTRRTAGAPRKIRTSDNRFRRPVLYPAELWAQNVWSRLFSGSTAFCKGLLASAFSKRPPRLGRSGGAGIGTTSRVPRSTSNLSRHARKVARRGRLLVGEHSTSPRPGIERAPLKGNSPPKSGEDFAFGRI
jgi:hypothetical protein